MKDGGSAEGLLGPLEYEVMRYLWADSPASVPQVLERLNDGRRKRDRLAYTTFMTVMARLHDKNLVFESVGDADSTTHRGSPKQGSSITSAGARWRRWSGATARLRLPTSRMSSSMPTRAFWRGSETPQDAPMTRDRRVRLSVAVVALAGSAVCL